MDKKSINLLPSYYKTSKNEKFLSGTIDQLIQTPKLDRLDGFVGSKLSKNYNPLTDNYISDKQKLRNDYQLEPGLVVKKLSQEISRAFTYDDLINQVSYHNGYIDNLDRVFRSDFYSYDPNVEWDKLVNFRQYYWLPTGPGTVLITGQQQTTISTYTINNTEDNSFFVFTPDGLTPSPQLTLYRGVTYIFDVSTFYKFYLKYTPASGQDNIFNKNILGNGTSNGQIIFSVDEQTPDVLYYNSNVDSVIGGEIVIKTLQENSVINVDKEIVGKKSYQSGNGVKFINGLKIRFGGQVLPSFYRDKEFIVEGVGDKIKLIEFKLLETPESVATEYDVNFDAENFDKFPFDNFKNVPLTPEYIVINRASKDLNAWSRFNRWFHSDVIRITAEYNNNEFILPVESRASRPIIEFKPDIQLWNHGHTGIKNVDLLDNFTTDVFSNVERATGYVVDGVNLEEGFRVIFNADPDPLVKGKVYEVTFVNIQKTRGPSSIPITERVISLVEVEDSLPFEGANVVITRGSSFKGSTWWFYDSSWKKAQQKTTKNQAPLYDLFDNLGNSYGGSAYTSNFTGNKIFGYSIGTGANDSILGFPLKYLSIGTESSYLFSNYFTTGSITFVYPDQNKTISSAITYLKSNANVNSPKYFNVWSDAEEYKIPILQFQVISTLTNNVEINCIDKSYLAYENNNLKIDVFINNKKTTDYSLEAIGVSLFVVFTNSLNVNDRVLFKVVTTQPANNNGTYEVPLNLSNNPLNGPISQFTLSELSDHVETMANRDPEYSGELTGSNNISELPFISKWGTRLISNKNPISFAHYFITDQSNNLIQATETAGDQYNQFKLNLIKVIGGLEGNQNPIDALDIALTSINENKNITFPYLLSGMVPYGTNKKIRTYTVTDRRNIDYSITDIYDPTAVTNKAILIYLNGEQLLIDKDYQFNKYESSVTFKIGLTRDDVIEIYEYADTDGCYIAPTPTKLGLYPKYEPMIYLDTTYADEPRYVIQGHDGSITLAFNDYRDQILLEYEKRIFNNIKTAYNPELLDINRIMPSVFRQGAYSYKEVYEIVQGLFLKWAGFYGVDYKVNRFYNVDNHKTYNYKSAVDYLFAQSFPGSWRAIYNYYFDTDRPDVCPWEMLGFTIKPEWWDSEYGPAPYTSGNVLMWDDLELGRVAGGSTPGVNPLYARPGLSNIIPVDENGNIVDPRNWAGIGQNDNIFDTDQDWEFGDLGPAETAWRRSSNWPFAVQIILAVCNPSTYASSLFDTSRLTKNIAGQYTYGDNHIFLNPSKLELHSDEYGVNQIIRASGYSVYVIEVNKQKNNGYLNILKEELANCTFNLISKVGGFVSKDKLSIVVDSTQIGSYNPNPFLPPEDYSVHFNVSNPTKILSISGIIIEKSQGFFVIRGYDKQSLYFKINKVVKQITDNNITINNKIEDFATWRPENYYQKGQVVFYESNYYRVTVSHNSLLEFNSKYYSILSGLPSLGGLSVSKATLFETTETIVPYETKMSTLQEVYDFFLGYGHWLETQGFIFDEYNNDFKEVIDWDFTAKEFLYWSTQNWADKSVITLSPFASSIKLAYNEGVVDDILNNFYGYNLLRADGKSFSINNFSLSRVNGVFSLTAQNTVEGFFYAKFYIVQKEHALIFNNTTIFSDIIYDVESGYRQRRVKLKGFRTADWNGDFISPGFIYDNASITDWKQYTDYKSGDIVRYLEKYYSAISKIIGAEKFDFTEWVQLPSRPEAQLLPNFDYKINQFEDFYSLDVDNFDLGQQKMSQHLIGYTPRPYLYNIFPNEISQYKFYQGFIKEKGTKNTISKLEKASLQNLQGRIEFSEEWAFRVGAYGSYSSFKQLEFPLKENDFVENNQIVQLVDIIPGNNSSVISYITPTELTIKPDDYSSDNFFNLSTSTFDNKHFVLLDAGYVRPDDVNYVLKDLPALLTIDNNQILNEGDKFWVGFTPDDNWNVYRYSRQPVRIVSVTFGTELNTVKFTTDRYHEIFVGDIISVTRFDVSLNKIYRVSAVHSTNTFEVESDITTIPTTFTVGVLFKFISARYDSFDDLASYRYLADIQPGELFWIDKTANGKWSVYKKELNFALTEYPSPRDNDGQDYGYSISKQEGNDTILIGAPDYKDVTIGFGKIYVYSKKGNTFVPLVNCTLNEYLNEYRSVNDPAPYGETIIYDETDDLLYATAPGANKPRMSPLTNSFRVAKGIYSESAYTNAGLVKISTLDRIRPFSEIPHVVLVDPNPQNNTRYGEGIFAERSKAVKKLLVGSPGQDSKNGIVYRYTVNITTSSKTYSSLPSYNVQGQGSGATFTVIKQPDESYNVTMLTSGTNYTTATSTQSIVTIYGNQIGGAIPRNNLIIKVLSTGSGGSIVSYAATGTGATFAFDITTSSQLSLLTDDLGQWVGRIAVTPGNSSNFVSGDDVIFSAPQLGWGTRAQGTVYAVNGNLRKIDIIDPGSGYTSAPTVSFVHGTLGSGSVTITMAKTSEFGYKIAGNKDASRIVVGAPGWKSELGAAAVYGYDDNADVYNLQQVILGTSVEWNSKLKDGDRLGSQLTVSEDGNYLFISSTTANDGKTRFGKVGVYSWNTETSIFEFLHILDNPSKETGITFGHSISVNSTATVLAVTSRGDNLYNDITFDNGETTFDSDACGFGELTNQAGTVYVYNRHNRKFILAQELFDSSVDDGSYYGQSVLVDNNQILVGSPGSTRNNVHYGSVYIWNEINPNSDTWAIHREQDDVVNLDKFNQITTVDLLDQQVIDYIDLYDPLKGRIPGLADQEIRYKTMFDPAVYSVGTSDITINTDSKWTNNQIGELWWDLSTVKYVWYEQGELTYRKSVWGKLFPGASIDVYEWVESTYLPSQWAAIADTNEGLSAGISGQPKYPTDTVYSSKILYDANTNLSTTYYYFWVKGKTVVPDVPDRRITSFEVAQIIEDPKAYGLRYISPVSNNSLVLTNFRSSLIGNRVHLNISYNTVASKINKHTEWLLLQENNENSTPNTRLERKLIDSLLGKDSIGNVVPDPALPARLKYGIEIRPRQSMFVDRYEALRNLFEYTNSVLQKTLVTGVIDFSLLNSKDPIPDVLLGEYDQLIEDTEAFNLISTLQFRTAKISCQIENGRITSFNIEDSGYGYLNPPTVEILNDISGAKAKTVIDDKGQVTDVLLLNSGAGFIVPPALKIRPYTVITQIDPNYPTKWSKYVWLNESWKRIQIQKFDTTKYWKFIDWKSDTYNKFKSLTVTVDEIYGLDTLDLNAGDYVKVNNPGDNRYVILSKTAPGVSGSFDTDYDIVYSENGTVQFSENLWNTLSSQIGFDQEATFDQMTFDETSEVELLNILNAIKTHIFSGPRRLYWNKIFFKMVKYAMSEQKFLDWAFKTSFINVKNIAGVLDQRTVYRFQDSTWYEDYLKEVKPYHTKIRNYQVNYQIGKGTTTYEPSNTYNTDFDLPAIYDHTLGKFSTLSLSDSQINTYPYKSWVDNYAYSVVAITLSTNGSGYRVPPKVEIISAQGDTGSGAEAIAYIALGKVISIEVTNPGSGYKKQPTVIISGGGDNLIIPALAYAQLKNVFYTTDVSKSYNTIRSITNRLKFDRVSTDRAIGDQVYTYTTTTNGSSYIYQLPWASTIDKKDIEVRLDDILVLFTDYNIVLYKEQDNVGGYHKLKSKISLTFVPTKAQVLSVKFVKNIDLYNATERIQDYYNPGYGMPGKDLPQLMQGAEYPGVRVDTVPFRNTAGWDSLDTGFSETGWDSNVVTSLAVTTVTEYAAVGSTSVSVASITGIVRGQTIAIRDNLLRSTLVESTDLSTATYYSVTATTTQTYTISVEGATYYYGVQSTGGSGSSATFDIIRQYGQYSLSVANSGTNYIYGNTLTIAGSLLGGTTATNDISVRVLSTSTNFGVGGFTSSGIAVVSSPAVFSINRTNSVYSTKIINSGSIYTVGSVFTVPGAQLGGTARNNVIVNVTAVNTYSQIVSFTSTGTALAGSGATFNVSRSNGAYSATFVNSGTGYNSTVAAGTRLTIYGDQLGGRKQVHDLTVTVLTTGTAGRIASFAITGTAVSPIIKFDSPSQSEIVPTAVANIYSFVTVDPNVDTMIDGGNLSYNNALGVGAADIVLDGDQFISPDTSYAPEEVVPGQIQESLGINVFTRAQEGSPVIVNQLFPVENTGTYHTITLNYQPGNADSIMFTYNGKSLNQDVDYVYDPIYNVITFPPQDTTGTASVSSIGVGGNQYLGSRAISVSGTSTVYMDSTALIQDIKSIYISVNGKTITTSSEVHYTLTPISNRNKRGRVTVYGLSTGSNIIQAWFFRGTYKGFSEVKEQIINADGITKSFNLIQMPGTVGPFHAQAIVEIDGLRLTPPDTVYYSVADNQTTFDVDPEGIYVLGRFTLSVIEVHVNGIRIVNGVDFVLDQPNNKVIFNSGFLKNGDVMAITVLVGNDYSIKDGKLVLTDTPANGSKIKVITYTNHDANFIRTETYKAHSSNLYVMSRPVMDISYVWVAINKKPLINKVDYTLIDGKTIRIDKDYPFSSSDIITIMSFSDVTASMFIGYRIFKDMLGRTHYKRFSEKHNTFLNTELLITDTEISVVDGSLLAEPNPKYPGVVLISGERIEYFAKDGNTLKNIKRSTLGTGAAFVYPAGTAVIDQGRTQTIPFNETAETWSTTTNYSTNTTFILNGIDITDSTTATNQVRVYYGGRMLNKLSTVVHNNMATYDSADTDYVYDPEYSIVPNTTGTYAIVLRNDIPKLTHNARLLVISDKSSSWYTRNGESLTVTDSVQAQFLQFEPSGLSLLSYDSLSLFKRPDDFKVELESGQVLTTEEDDPLEGI
jgi:hypothetical protein